MCAHRLTVDRLRPTRIAIEDTPTLVVGKPTKVGWCTAVKDGSIPPMVNPTTGSRPYTPATTALVVVALSQGAIPLVTRGLLNRKERLAPASWLNSPWWWIACLTIVIFAFASIAAIETRRQRQHLTDASDVGGGPEVHTDTKDPDDPDEVRSQTFDALSGLVLLVGLYNGVAPLVARLAFDTTLFLALPLRLAAPWWWITSLAVMATTVFLLVTIDWLAGATRRT